MGMDKLGMLYLQLKKLRAGGVKMKDIAQAVGMQQSVLSSLYSSVLPTYTALTDEGVDAVDALDKALKHVTSVSKRRLLTSVDDLYSRVCAVSQSLIGDCENLRFPVRRLGGGGRPLPYGSACLCRSVHRL